MRDQLLTAASGALSAMTENQRIAYTAKIEGLTYKQIGAMLGVTWSTARHHHVEAELRVARAVMPILYGHADV